MSSDQTKNPVLVACVVIKNDTQHIKSLVSSLAPHVDGIVVKDNSDSYTATVNNKLFESMCKHFGIKTFLYSKQPDSRYDCIPSRDNDDMAACKNQLLDMAFRQLHARYALVIDADEEFFYTGINIRHVLDSPDICPIFEIPVVGLHTLPGDEQSAYQTYQSKQPRIVSCKSTDRYIYPYHEILTKSNERSLISAVIYHKGYKISEKDAMTKCHERVKRMLKNDCMGMDPVRYIELIGTTLDAAGYTELGEVFLSVVGKGKEKLQDFEFDHGCFSRTEAKTASQAFDELIGRTQKTRNVALDLNRVEVKLDPRVAIRMPDAIVGITDIPFATGQTSNRPKADMSFEELVKSLMSRLAEIDKK